MSTASDRFGFLGGVFRRRPAAGGRGSRRRRSIRRDAVRPAASRPAIESLEQRLALSVTVTGTKWLDINGNGIRDNDLIQGDAPDVVFVVDVSLSTSTKFSGTPVGDINGDGASDDILDASLAGFIALNEQLRSLPGISDRARIGIVAFGETAEFLDMDPQTPGVQVFARPKEDRDSSGTNDVEQALRGIRRGLGGTINAGWTNYEAALQKATAVFDTLKTASGEGNLVFLSDGQPNKPSASTAAYADEAQALRARGYNLRAFGALGAGVSLPPLQVIDPVVAGSRPGAQLFASTDELVGVFAGLRGDSLRYTEPGLAGVKIYIDINDNGIWDGADEPSAISRADDPATPNVDETGTYTISTGIVPPAGTYRVREVVPDGYVHTSLGTLSIPDPANALQRIRNEADGSWVLSIPAGQSRSNIDFGNAPGSISGVKWRDDDPNGIRDSSLVVGSDPDVVFVIDVSGSTQSLFGGTPVGDVNNDGESNTILDAEIQGFIRLNEQLVTQGLGTRARVSIVVFGGQAAALDMNPAAGDQKVTVTNPTADIDRNGVTDVEQILRSIVYGGTRQGIDVDSSATNYQAALATTEQVLVGLGTPAGQGNMVFLSDGAPNSGAYAAEVTKLKGRGVNLRAFGAGDGAQLAPLQEIDPNAVIFRTADELIVAFGTPQGASATAAGFSEPGLAGVRIYVDLNKNGRFDAGEPTAITQADNPATKNVDETGWYEIKGLGPGTYTVREVVPAGSIQTSKGSVLSEMIPAYPGADYGYGYTYRQVDYWEITIGGSGPARATNVNFGNAPGGGEISGVKWRDDNRNGIRDGGLVVGEDPHVVFAIDVSGSVSFSFSGSPVGDINRDGDANTVLDAELAGLISINNQLIAQGYGATGKVSIVVFGERAQLLSLPAVAGGTSTAIAPNQDANGNGISDIEEAIRTVTIAGTSNGINVGQGEENFELALQQAIVSFQTQATAPGRGNVILLSDGYLVGNAATAVYTDEIAALQKRGVNIRAFGAGTYVNLPTLQTVDANAIAFRTTDELLAAFGSPQGGGGGGGSLEPGMAGVQIYIDLDNDGQWDAGEPKTVTAADDPKTPGVDEAGSYSFKGLAAGTYTVREIVPASHTLTSLGTLGKFTYDVDGRPASNANNNSDGSWTVKLGYDANVTYSGLGDYAYTDTWYGHCYPVSAASIDFGNAPPAEIQGLKWLDYDGDGTRDECYDSQSVVFAVDVSGSTWNRFLGTYAGDINGDGKPNTVLDAQLEAVLHLHDQLVTTGDPYAKLLGLDYAGSNATVSLVVYGSTAAAIDLDPVAPGIQTTVIASADRNQNGIADFVEAVQSIREGHAGVGVGANYEAALGKVAEVAPIGSRLAFFADGPATTGGTIGDELAALDAKGVSRAAIGVGTMFPSDPDFVVLWKQSLDEIDSGENAQFFISCEDLRYVLDDFGCVHEPGLPGVAVYVDLNDNRVLDADERKYSAVTREDDPATLADESGTYVIKGLPAGTYRVREVLPVGYLQTYPAGSGTTAGSHQVTITTGQGPRGIDFGNQINPLAPMVKLPGPSLNGRTTSFPAMLLDPHATVIDIDSETLVGGSLRVAVATGTASTITLGIQDQGPGIETIRVTGKTVTFNGRSIGTFTGGEAGTPLAVTFNASASPRAAEALLRAVTVRGSGQGAHGERLIAVRMTDSDGNVGIVRTKKVVVRTPPAAPPAPAGQEGDAQVRLTWNPPAGDGGAPVTSYVVETSSNGGVSWTRVAGTGFINPAATITGLTNNVAYIFRVAAVNSEGTGAFSAASAAIKPVKLTLLEDIGSVSLATDPAGNLRANGIVITANGQPVRPVTSPTAIWRYVAADVDGGRNTVVLQNTSKELFFWRLDASWARVSTGNLTSAGTAAFFAAEQTFSVDFDGDGIIGPRITTIERSGTVSLGYDITGTLRANDAVITRNGSPVMHVASPTATWRYVAADVDGGRNTVVVQHSSGSLFLWRMDATWKQLSSDAALAKGTAGFTAAEQRFGMDFDGDGKIGGNTVVETSGVVALTVDASGFLRVNNRLIRSNGAVVRQATGPTAVWRYVAAEVDGGRNTVVLQHSSGFLSFWRMDAAWARVSTESSIPVGTAAFVAAEQRFGVDFDGNGMVGAGTVIENAGATVLSYDNGGNLRANGTLITANGQPIRHVTSPTATWRYIAADVDGGRNTLVVQNASGSLFIRRMDASWKQVSAEAAMPKGSAAFMDAEHRFGTDFDRDGTIGAPRVALESAGSVTLAYDAAGNLRANGTLITLNGQPVRNVADPAAVWRYVAAEADGGRNTVVLQHSSKALYFWRMDAAWKRVAADGWTPVGTPGFRAAETTFGVDFDGNGTIGG